MYSAYHLTLYNEVQETNNVDVLFVVNNNIAQLARLHGDIT